MSREDWRGQTTKERARIRYGLYVLSPSLPLSLSSRVRLECARRKRIPLRASRCFKRVYQKGTLATWSALIVYVYDAIRNWKSPRPSLSRVRQARQRRTFDSEHRASSLSAESERDCRYWVRDLPLLEYFQSSIAGVRVRKKRERSRAIAKEAGGSQNSARASRKEKDTFWQKGVISERGIPLSGLARRACRNMYVSRTPERDLSATPPYIRFRHAPENNPAYGRSVISEINLLRR